MALTERYLETDNTVGPFAIGFDYQKAADIKVILSELDETSPEALTFTFAGTHSELQPSGTAVLLTSPAPRGKQLRIFKDVSLAFTQIDWTDGASLTDYNLNTMNINLMEMAQVAFDAANRVRQLALDTAQGLSTIEGTVQGQLDVLTAIAADTLSSAQALLDQAAYWAQVALDAGSTANPEEAAAIARDAAITARDAAQAAQSASEDLLTQCLAARDLAYSARDAAQASAVIADSYANSAKGVEVASGKFSARHFAETAQDIIDTGAVRWNGAAKFVSTLDPDPLLGINGDFWFKRLP